MIIPTENSQAGRAGSTPVARSKPLKLLGHSSAIINWYPLQLTNTQQIDIVPSMCVLPMPGTEHGFDSSMTIRTHAPLCHEDYQSDGHDSWKCEVHSAWSFR